MPRSTTVDPAATLPATVGRPVGSSGAEMRKKIPEVVPKPPASFWRMARMLLTSVLAPGLGKSETSAPPLRASVGKGAA